MGWMALAHRMKSHSVVSAQESDLSLEMHCGKKKLYLTASTHSFWADPYARFRHVAREIYKIVTFP